MIAQLVFTDDLYWAKIDVEGVTIILPAKSYDHAKAIVDAINA